MYYKNMKTIKRFPGTLKVERVSDEAAAEIVRNGGVYVPKFFWKMQQLEAEAPKVTERTAERFGQRWASVDTQIQNHSFWNRE
jgi:hypothetical protein